MTSKRFVFAYAAMGLFVLGCNRVDPKSNSEPGSGALVVYTVNYPLKYFSDRIGGEHVDVIFPVPPDQDPAFWSPDSTTVSAYQKGDLILLNGAAYANWISKVTLPESKVVNTTLEVKDDYIAVADAVTHSHGPGVTHAHEGIAFTTWLDPEIAIIQAKAIHDALARSRPAHKVDFKQNFEALNTDLLALAEKLDKATRGAPQQPIVFSHPVYQYLQRTYGLNGKSVRWEPDTFPSDDDWEEFRDLLRSHPAKWMIWEGKPIDENIQQLSDLGINSVVFDPCGNTPDDGVDWLQVMNANAAVLARVYTANK